MTTVRVAVIGAGVAGLSLVHALSHHKHIDAHIFELGAELVQPGFAFGIACQAKDALALLSPTSGSALELAGGVAELGFRSFLAGGPNSGDLLLEMNSRNRMNATIVERANFLREFQSGIPADHTHLSKKLDRIEERLGNGAVLLHFTDGSTHECDVLIGTDGLHSVVRKHILGDDIAASPRNSGMWAIMTLNPYEKVQETLGVKFLDRDKPYSHGWYGDGFFMMHNMLNFGSTAQFTVAVPDEGAVNSPEWKKELTRDEIIDTFIGKGAPTHLEKTVMALLCDVPQQTAFYLRDHPPARTYTKGPICVAGDAAHTTTPWQASGAAMSIEDSLILSSLLNLATSPAEARVALKAYDQVRRPRTQRIVESSLDMGRLLTGRYVGVGLDKDKFREQLAYRWRFIVELDVAEHREEALQLMKQLLQQQRET